MEAAERWLTRFVELNPVSIEDARGDVVPTRRDDRFTRADDDDACHRFVADRTASLFRCLVSHSESKMGSSPLVHRLLEPLAKCRFSFLELVDLLLQVIADAFDTRERPLPGERRL